MSDWITLTDEDVTARLNAAEIAAISSLLTGGVGTIAEVLTDEVESVRGSIKMGGNQRGPDGTIPASIKKHIIASVIWELLNSLPENKKIQSAPREKANERAQDIFAAIEKGEKKVELPDVGDPVDTVAAPVNAIQKASGERRQFTRRKLRGL